MVAYRVWRCGRLNFPPKPTKEIPVDPKTLITLSNNTGFAKLKKFLKARIIYVFIMSKIIKKFGILLCQSEGFQGEKITRLHNYIYAASVKNRTNLAASHSCFGIFILYLANILKLCGGFGDLC